MSEPNLLIGTPLTPPAQQVGVAQVAVVAGTAAADDPAGRGFGEPPDVRQRRRCPRFGFGPTGGDPTQVVCFAHAGQNTDAAALADLADRPTHYRVRRMNEDDLATEFRSKLCRDRGDRARLADPLWSRNYRHGNHSGDVSASTPAVTNARRASSMSRWL